MKIPRIIHHIYEDMNGPSESMLAVSATWKEYNPDWEHRFWNKIAMEDFLQNYFPDFIPIYRTYPYNVQRWDSIRYLILYKIGGMYVDMDYECLEPMEDTLSEHLCCFGVEPPFHAQKLGLPGHYIGNALMASVPGHPFMKHIIDHLVESSGKLWSDDKSNQVLESTGPLMVTRLYDGYEYKQDVTLLPYELVTPLDVMELYLVRNNRATEEIEQKIEAASAIHYFFNSWTPQVRPEVKLVGIDGSNYG